MSILGVLSPGHGPRVGGGLSFPGAWASPSSSGSPLGPLTSGVDLSLGRSLCPWKRPSYSLEQGPHRLQVLSSVSNVPGLVLM